MLEEGLQAAGAVDRFLYFGELTLREFFPARPDGSVLFHSAQEQFDFGQGEAHFGSKANQQNAVQGFGGVAALVAVTLGYWKQANLFVVANRRGIQFGATCQLPYFHNVFFSRVPHRESV